MLRYRFKRPESNFVYGIIGKVFKDQQGLSAN